MAKKELKKYTTRAMKLEDGPIPEAVFLPPAIRGNLVKVAYEGDGKVTSMKDHVVRINYETDPVGMLIALANGQPVPTVKIDRDGNAVTVYETLDLKDRITVIKFLSDKVLPRMSVFKKVEGGDQGPPDEGWGALLTNAAEREGD